MFQKKGRNGERSSDKIRRFAKKQTSGELAPVEIEKQAALLKLEEAKLGEFENQPTKDI